jgi:hypothetical protein
MLGKRRASLAAAVIVIRSSAQKRKLILIAWKVAVSLWVAAEDAEASLSTYGSVPIVLNSTSSGGVAW